MDKAKNAADKVYTAFGINYTTPAPQIALTLKIIFLVMRYKDVFQFYVFTKSQLKIYSSSLAPSRSFGRADILASRSFGTEGQAR